MNPIDAAVQTWQQSHAEARIRLAAVQADVRKYAFEFCRTVVRREYPTARYVTLAVVADDGYFLNGVKSITDTNEEYLFDNRSFDDEASEEIERLPWDDLFDADQDWEDEFSLDLDNGADD